MYPFFRLAKERLKHRRAGALAPGEAHMSYHICWPWDLDVWNELNNGRTLTLFDLGRLPLFDRCGITGACKRKGWGLAVAGASLRYRKRVKAFDLIEMHSALLGWDARFFYVAQSMSRQDEHANQGLFRIAVANASGIVAPGEVARTVGWDAQSPELPDWVQAWSTAENQRPWPPVE